MPKLMLAGREIASQDAEGLAPGGVGSQHLQRGVFALRAQIYAVCDGRHGLKTDELLAGRAINHAYLPFRTECDFDAAATACEPEGGSAIGFAYQIGKTVVEGAGCERCGVGEWIGLEFAGGAETLVHDDGGTGGNMR